MRQRALVAGLMAIVVVLSWASSALAAGSITSYTTGLQPEAAPTHLSEGPEGNLWFTDGNEAIGRMTPGGTITEFPVDVFAQRQPFDITAGPDGNLWFTDSPPFGQSSSAIGRITPSGDVTEFNQGHYEDGEAAAVAEPDEIVAGPDGNLWFTDRAFVGGQPAIGRITPSGTITEFKLPGYSDPSSIVVGPDGNLWYTNWGKAPNLQAIGKITPSGEVTEYLVPEQWPTDIVSGPDGALWFTNERGAIGKITTGGVITEYRAGLLAGSQPSEIVVGGEGNLWFTDRGALHIEEGGGNGAIGRITPGGSIAEFGTDLAPGSIAVGPDGNIWAGDSGHGLDRVTPSGQVTYFWLGLIEDGASDIRDLAAGPGTSGLWFTNTGFSEAGEAIGAIGKVAPVGPTGTTPLPTVAVEMGGVGSGVVTSSPPGISCPGICSSHFAPGTEMTLTETASPGSFLLFGSVGLAGADPCPDPEPAVERHSSTCHFTVNGDALASVDFDNGGGEEPAIGGGPPPGPTAVPANPSPTSSPNRPAPTKPKPLRCRKGFKKERVRGKAKCVNVRNKRHQHR